MLHHLLVDVVVIDHTMQMAFLGFSMGMAEQALFRPADRFKAIVPVVKRVLALDRHHCPERERSERREPKDVKTTIFIVPDQDSFLKAKLCLEVCSEFRPSLKLGPRGTNSAEDTSESRCKMPGRGYLEIFRLLANRPLILGVGNEIDVLPMERCDAPRRKVIPEG